MATGTAISRIKPGKSFETSLETKGLAFRTNRKNPNP